MRIAQVAPLDESVPPKTYGGTERVVHYLTEELVRRGHEVTLFASGDSHTSARLVPLVDQALVQDERSQDRLPHHLLMLERVLQEAREFDLIHFHCDYLHFPLSRRTPVAMLTTLHGRLDIPDLVPLYHEFAEVPLVSISEAQRAPLAHAYWVGTVYHGLPEDLYRAREQRGDYLAMLGRISPEKGVPQAIEIATRAGLELRIAAKVDPTDQEYFEQSVRHLLERPGVKFLGEVDEAGKQELLAGALGLLFPVDWPEPFGLVMIEALACGTPVVAFRRGSVPEVIEDGVTGFVVDDIEHAVEAVKRLPELSRRDCRAAFERRFTAARMAEDYLALYDRMVKLVAAAPATELPPWGAA